MHNRNTIIKLQQMKGKERIACLTAYDYLSAGLLDTAGMDLLLVGDSLGMVVQGKKDTLGVTLEDMIYHTKMVVNGSKKAFIAADMPFGTYRTLDTGLKNAVKLIQKTGAGAVKMEGAGKTVRKIITRLNENGILSIAHIGLKPQMHNITGGYKVQGRENHDEIVDEALELEASGACIMVIEGVTSECAEEITSRLYIPTIGIGAGIHCDGQILVYHDALGFFTEFIPKFVKQFADGAKLVVTGAESYIKDVKNGHFPAVSHTYSS